MEYNENNDLVSDTIIDEQNNEIKTLRKYKYNKNKKPIEISYTNNRNDEEVIETLVYDKNNNLIFWTNTLNYEKFVIYDKNGNKYKSLTVNDGNLEIETINTYNEYNKILSSTEIIYKKDNTILNKNIYSYEYDDRQNLIRIKRNGILKMKFKYDEFNNEIEYHVLDTGLFVKTEYDYFE